jgi:hypothetical protein
VQFPRASPSQTQPRCDRRSKRRRPKHSFILTTLESNARILGGWLLSFDEAVNKLWHGAVLNVSMDKTAITCRKFKMVHLKRQAGALWVAPGRRPVRRRT